jgi:hypothetical protein
MNLQQYRAIKKINGMYDKLGVDFTTTSSEDRVTPLRHDLHLPGYEITFKIDDRGDVIDVEDKDK